jgi:TIR domain
VGDSLVERIRRGIDDVEFVVAVISMNSISSRWVQHELDVAMNQEISGKRVKVLPVLLDDSDLPGFLLGKSYADFRRPDRYWLGLARLVARLDLDLDPLPTPRLEPYVANTRDAHLMRARLYNELAMKIMEWAGHWDSSPGRWLRPESWKEGRRGNLRF